MVNIWEKIKLSFCSCCVGGHFEAIYLQISHTLVYTDPEFRGQICAVNMGQCNKHLWSAHYVAGSVLGMRC